MTVPNKEIEKTTVVGHAHFVFSLLLERGPFSSEIFQPAVNHRSLNHLFFSSERRDENKQKVYRPMFKSFYEPEQGEEFTLLTPISFYLTEIICEDNLVDGNDADFVPSELGFRSLSEHYISAGTERHLGFGYIKGIRARRLSLRTLQRLFEFVGYQLTDESGESFSDEKLDNPATVSQICTFASLVAPYDIGKREGFCDFLRVFRMESIFRYRDDIDHSIQLRAFGDTLRTVTRARSSIFEGQHRGKLIYSFLIGVLHPKLLLPNKFTGWKNASVEDLPLSSDFDDIDSCLNRCQALSPLDINIGIPVVDTPLDDPSGQFTVLRNYGKDVTEGGELAIPVTFCAAMKDILTKIRDAMLVKNRGYKALDYSTFWKVAAGKQVDKNCQLINSAFWAVLEDNRTYAPVLVKNYDMIPKLFRETKTEVKKRLGELSVYPPATPTGNWPSVSIFFQYVVLMVQCGVYSLDWLSVLNRYYSYTAPTVPQSAFNDSPDRYLDRFYSIEWMRHHIFTSHFEAKILFEEKVTVERRILELIRDKALPDLKVREEAITNGSYDFRDYKPLITTLAFPENMKLTEKILSIAVDKDGNYLSKNKDNIWEKISDFGDRPKFLCDWEKKAISKEKNPASKTPRNKKNKNDEEGDKKISNLYRGSTTIPILTKVKMFGSLFILVDIFKTIEKYGFDPKIPETGGKNSALNDYMR